MTATHDIAALCAAIDTGDDTALLPLADLLEEMGDPSAAGLRRCEGRAPAASNWPRSATAWSDRPRTPEACLGRFRAPGAKKYAHARILTARALAVSAEACQPKSRNAARRWCGPTRAPPGTGEKMEIMAFRAAVGLPLFHPGDEVRIDWRRLEEELGGGLSLRLRMENTERKHRLLLACGEEE